MARACAVNLLFVASLQYSIHEKDTTSILRGITWRRALYG